MEKKKDAPLMIRGVTPKDKKRIQKVAKEDGYGSMSAFVRKLLFNHLKEKGA